MVAVISSVVVLVCLVLAFSQSESSSRYGKKDIASCLRLAYRNYAEYKHESTASKKQHDYSRHQNLEPKPYAKDCHNMQMPFSIATQMLCKKHNLSIEGVQALRDVPVEQYVELKAVQDCKNAYETPHCNSSNKYRTFDGSCNNLIHPRWGATYNCYQRFLYANYDGESGFRRSGCGGPLPNPRKISLLIHCQCNRPAPFWNQLFVYFGQAVAHEMALTPDITANNNARIECCQSSGKKNPSCCPIHMSTCDPFYSKFNTTCMNVVRSAACSSCTLGPRQHFSQVSATMDASLVYSSNETEAGQLREYKGGEMKCQDTESYGDFLPVNDAPIEDPERFNPKKEVFCYKAGDTRVNQHALLMAIQTVLMRDHNRLCKKLSAMCPKWKDEKLFQEARRIVAAQFQMITYNEYLPVLLGPEAMKQFDLTIKTDGPTKYNQTMDCTMWVEFLACFRMGHTMVDTVIARGWPSRYHEWKLRDSYFNCSFMYDGMLDSLFSKITTTPGQSFDKCIQRDLSDFALRYPGECYGEDLSAVDLHRSLDHGIPTYTDMVAFCTKNATVIKNWEDLYSYGVIKHEIIKQLQGVYCDVRDMHLWTGILCETQLARAAVGPTAACIMGIQFQTCMYGDRFFFQHAGEVGSFTSAQREALKSATLSKLICCNTKADSMPEKAMLFPNSTTNPVLPCCKIKCLDLSAWSDCA